MKTQRLYLIISIVLILLSIPFIAMQFTNEVNWSVFDFVVMGLMLFSVGIAIDLVLRKIERLNIRLIVLASIIISFLLIWGELAVGLFGTPFAGS